MPRGAQTWRDVITVHPAADLFPLMGDAELRELAADIKANDLHEKIKIVEKRRRQPDEGTRHLGDFEQIVLDGRNRLDAMELAGYPIFSRGTIELNPDIIELVPAETDPVAYVIGVNIRRRHLTGEQKRNLIAQLLKTNPERSNRVTAEIVHVDDKTVASVRRELEATAELPQLKTRTGKDGKARPATKLPEKAAVATSAKVDDRPLDKRVDGVLVHSALMNLVHALGTTEPEAVAAYVWPDEVRELRDEVETIRNWLDRFIALLPKDSKAQHADKAKAEALN